MRHTSAVKYGKPRRSARSSTASTATGTTNMLARSTTISTSSRATTGHKSVMTYLDIELKRAYISRELAGLDDSDLVVAFRRGKKEIISNAAFWDKRSGITSWEQRMAIQTTINRAPTGEFLTKEYELALIARPSNTTVASFILDFSQFVTPTAGQKGFRLCPKRCLDKNARLEVEVSWDFPNGPDQSSASVANSLSSVPGNMSIASHASDASFTHARNPSEASSVTSASGTCECRSLKRRLERKEQQLNQAEIFLKESQKRLNRLKQDQDQLQLREEAETQASLQTYAILIRLMQEMELALKLCCESVHVSQVASKSSCSGDNSDADDPALDSMHANEVDLLPKLELLDRIKLMCHDIQIVRSGGKVHAIKSPGLDFVTSFKNFNFQHEIADALDRNERLHRYLVLLNESFGSAQLGFEELTNMAKSAASQEENAGLISTLHSNNRTYLTMNEQMNRLERENVLLKAKIKNLELANNGSCRSAKESQLLSGTNPLSELFLCTNSEATTCNSSVFESETTKTLNVVNETEVKSEVASNLDNTFDVMVSECDDERDQLRQTNLSLVNQLDMAKKEISSLRGSTTDEMSRETTMMFRVSGMNSPCGRNVGAGKSFGLGKGLMDLRDTAICEVSSTLEVEADTKLAALQETLNMLYEEKERYRYLAAKDASVAASEAAVFLAPVSAAVPAPGPSEEEIEARIEQQFEGKLQLLQQELETKHAKEREEWVKTHTQQALRPGPSEAEIEARIEEQSQAKLNHLREELEAQHEKDRKEWEKLREKQFEQEKNLCKTIAQLRREMNNLNVSDVNVADLQKQLKNAKQEAMELRYRSNASELLQQQLEEAVKDKKSLEVKLTALEGQLFEYRGRGISDVCQNEQKEQQLRELRNEMEKKHAELELLRKQNEHLKKVNGGSGNGDQLGISGGSGGGGEDRVENLSKELAKVINKVEILCEQNAEQDRHSEQLQLRLRQEQQFRKELEKVIQELMQEMENFQKISGTPNGAAALEDSMIRLSDPVPRKPLPLLQPNHAMASSGNDVFLNQVKPSPTRSDRGSNCSRNSKVAMLIQNFAPKESSRSSRSSEV